MKILMIYFLLFILSLSFEKIIDRDFSPEILKENYGIELKENDKVYVHPNNLVDINQPVNKEMERKMILKQEKETEKELKEENRDENWRIKEFAVKNLNNYEKYQNYFEEIVNKQPIVKKILRGIDRSLQSEEEEDRERMMKEMIKIMKRKFELEDWLQDQVYVFKKWKKEMIKAVKHEFDLRKEVWLLNDESNRSEHEKMYQLMLVQEIDKRNELIMKAQLEADLQEYLALKEQKYKTKYYIKKAILLMTKQLVKETEKGFKKFQKKKKSDYYKSMKRMDARFTDEYIGNSRLGGDAM